MGAPVEPDLSRRLSPARPRALATRAVLVAACLVAGCGSDDADPLPRVCDDGVAAVQAALASAPGPVALGGATKLSTCVERARSGADIQTVGAIYTNAARDLAAGMRASDVRALRLGYLLGAARRGASRSGGIHEELLRRLEQAAALEGVPPGRRAAYRRGLAAGRRSG